MSEDLPQASTVQPIGASVPSVTYEDLLGREDLHPALRPHIERLAVERADSGRSNEISPEHHQHHVELSRQMVPDIDKLPASEQDFIGEVVEVGEEALEVHEPTAETLTPEAAFARIKSMIDAAEKTDVSSEDKAPFLQSMTSLLRITATKKDSRETHEFFREDEHFQKLGIRSKGMIKNSLDRELHKKILNGMGLTATPEEQAQIEQYFATIDQDNKIAHMQSYAQNGLLTLSSAVSKGVLGETSSTPGDNVSDEGILEVRDEKADTIRGYVVTPEDTGYDLFYGRNSFFGVVMERGGEDIDRASILPKEEVENRARNSMLFAINTNKLNVSSRTDNAHHEDVISEDIPPASIDYVLVDEANYTAAQEAFGNLPIKILKVESIETELHSHYDNPYRVPNYKKAIEQITAVEGSVWCHISRLPVDTYPQRRVA